MKKANRKLKFFSTFTGIGGLDYGLEKIGAECVGFAEIRKSSIKTYQGHYLDRKNYGDITLIQPEKLPDFDVFTGGFPCQSFSLAGLRKGFGDRRGQMIFYIYDILMAKKPEYVILENVKGIVAHNNGDTYRSVFKLLWSAGYFVRVVLLNSANYGSAQARERVIFICRRSKDFEAKHPDVRDNTKTFRDIREKPNAEFKYLSDKVINRLERNDAEGFLPIGGYDRVNTITTGQSSSGRDQVIVKEGKKWRYLTAIEGERLQGFPDDWTKGGTVSDRWFAIGNAVNCKVSEYLFTDYLKGLWW